MSNGRENISSRELLARLAREGTQSEREVSIVTSPGSRESGWAVKVKSHSSYNVYNVIAVEIGSAGSLPVEIGQQMQAVNLAESFLQQGTLQAGTYAVMSRVGAGMFSMRSREMGNDRRETKDEGYLSEPVRLGQFLPQEMRNIEKRVKADSKTNDTRFEKPRNWEFNRQINVSVLVQLLFLASLIVGSWVNLQRQLDLLQRDVTYLCRCQENVEQKLESLWSKSISYEYRLRALEKALTEEPPTNVSERTF